MKNVYHAIDNLIEKIRNYVIMIIEKHYIVIFAIIALIIGIIYLLMFQAKDIPDNFPNYMTSYALADKLTGRNVTITDSEFRGIKGQKIAEIDVRECDMIWFSDESDYAINADTYVKENSKAFVGEQTYKTKAYEIHTYSIFPTYIVDAMAIILGRILHFGPYTLFCFVRVVNLFVYICCGIFAIKFFSEIKEFIFVLWLIPAGIQFAVSTSHESLWWPFAWIYIFYIISAAQKNELMTVKEMVLIIILSCLIAPIKGQGIGFVLLIFLINKKRFVTKKTAMKFMLGCFAISFVVWIIYNLKSVSAQNIFFPVDGGRYVKKTESEAVYVSDLITHPLHYLRIIVYTFSTWFIYFKNCFYPHNIYYSEVATYGFMGVFLLSILEDNESAFKLSLHKRIYIMFEYVILYFLLCILTLLSWVGKNAASAVVKIQYVIPFLPFIGLMLKNGKLIYKGKNRMQIIVCGVIFWHIVGLLSSLMYFIVYGKLA